MDSGCPKSVGQEGRVAYAAEALRVALLQDLVLIAVFLQLLWGQRYAGALGVVMAPTLPVGVLLWRAASLRLPLAMVLLIGGASVGSGGMQMVRPGEAALGAVLELLGGATTRRVELELRIESQIERRAAGAGRARVSTFWKGVRLELLATFPELPWIGRGFLAPGDRLRVLGKVRAAGGEGVFSFGEFLLRRGMVGSVRVVHVDAVALGAAQLNAREELLRRLLERHPLVDGFGVMVAGAFGVGDLLSEEVVALFRETGLTHLLVVSGYHVGVLFTAIYGGATCGIRLVPLLTAVVPLPVLASLVALMLGAAYVGFVGAALTTVRALISVAFVLVAKMFAYNITPRRTLLLVMLLSACCWPGSAFEAGYQLTFAALFGLYYGGVWGSARWFQFRVGKIRSQLQSTVFASLGATLFTTPVMLCWFSTLAPLALLFNLIAGGIFSLLFILLAGALFFARACGVAIADYGIDLVAAGAEYYLTALEWLAKLVAASPARYREFEPDTAKRIAAVMGALLSCGIVLGERHVWRSKMKVFAKKGLKNHDTYATLPDRQRAIEQLQTF